MATVPQYPMLGYRLDLAVPELKIDIEVDGERYHRDPVTGRRKAEDLWRDLSLQGAGWHVVRFWVFELREDLDKCVCVVSQACEQRRQAGLPDPMLRGGEAETSGE